MKIDRKQLLVIILGAVLIFMVYLSGMFYNRSIPLKSMNLINGINSEGEISDSSPAPVTYGPYISIKKGVYKLNLRYEADMDNYVRITAFKGETSIGEGVLPAGKNKYSIRFEAPCDMRDNGVEFIVDYKGGSLKIDSMSVSNARIYYREALMFILFILISVAFVLYSGVEHKGWYLFFYAAMNLLLGGVMAENIIFLLLMNIVVCYFAFLDKRLLLNRENSPIYTAIIIFAYSIIIFCTKSSPLYVFQDWVDTQSYYTMGKGIFSGRAIYRDLFEQKGPLFYLLYGIGYLINSHNLYGEYFMEGIAASLFLIYTYKTARMYLSRNMSLMAVIIMPVFIYNERFMRFGGTCEEFMIPILLMSIYYFLQIFKENKPARKYMIINGFLGAVILMMKFNIALFFGGMGLCVFLMNIRNKDFKNLSDNLMAVSIGAAIVVLPVIIWLALSGSLLGFFEVINFNSTYSGLKMNADGLYKTIRNAYGSFNGNWFMTVIMVLGLSAFTFIRDFSNKWGSAGLILSFIFLSYIVYAGLLQPYYYMVLSPFAVLGIIAVLYFAENHGLRAVPEALMTLAVVSLVVTVHYNNNIKETKPFIEYVPAQEKFAMIMKSKTDEPTLLNYGSLDGGFYTAADIVPNVRFFQKQNVSDSDYPLNIQTQKNAMADKAVRFVVVRRFESDGEDNTRELRDNYDLIAQQHQNLEGYSFIYYLYEAKQ